MFINFARKLFELLIEDEFFYIKQTDNRLVYDTGALSLYKDKGSILYIVTIINAKTLPKEKYNEIIIKYSNLLDGQNRAQVIMMNVIADDAEGSFETEEDFLPDKKSYVFSYDVDLEYNTLKTPDSQPDLLDMNKRVETALAEPTERYVNGTHLGTLESELYEKYTMPVKSKNSLLTFSMMALCIALWALMVFCGGSENEWTLTAFGAVSRDLVLGGGQYYRVFTAIFLHANLAHLSSNCLSLYIFGSRVERYFGKFMFIVIFLVAGVLGNIITICFLSNLSVGASGAIFGLLGALLAVSYRSGHSVGGLSPYVIVLLCISSIGFGFITPAVNNFAHIGGFAAGGFIGFFFYNARAD